QAGAVQGPAARLGGAATVRRPALMTAAVNRGAAVGRGAVGVGHAVADHAADLRIAHLTHWTVDGRVQATQIGVHRVLGGAAVHDDLARCGAPRVAPGVLADAVEVAVVDRAIEAIGALRVARAIDAGVDRRIRGHHGTIGRHAVDRRIVGLPAGAA